MADFSIATASWEDKSKWITDQHRHWRRIQDINEPKVKLMRFFEFGAQVFDAVTSIVASAATSGPAHVPIPSMSAALTKLFYNPEAEANEELEELITIISQVVADIAANYGKTEQEIWEIRKQLYELDPIQAKTELFQRVFFNTVVDEIAYKELENEMFRSCLVTLTTSHFILLREINQNPDFTTEDLWKLNLPHHRKLVSDLSGQGLIDTRPTPDQPGTRGYKKLIWLSRPGRSFIAFII